MANKIIKTRIKNRFDSLSNWQANGVELLQGEIALVKVTTQQLDAATGKVVNVPALLMKVGENDENGSPKAFSALPWLSAKAADVYDWAKEQDPSNITIKYNKGTATNANWQNSTLADVLKDLETAKADIAALKTNVLGSISVDPATATTNGVVQGITYNSTGKFTVTYGPVAEADIANSAVTTNKIKDANVTTGKIADSAVTDAKIASGVSSDKISVDTGTADGTLSKKLSTMDASIAANTAKLTGHTDAEINTLIDNKLGNLDLTADPASGGEATATENFVTQVRQTDGLVSYSRKTLPVATSSKKGIVLLGANGGAATYASIYGTDGKGGINKQVETNKTDIANIKTAIAGGVHFRGTVTAKPTTASVKVNGTTTITAAAGDIVLWSAEGIEYIYTGSAWEELGDVTRLGELETKVDNLDYNGGDFGEHKFVTKVTQTDGLIEATYEQPSSEDITHSNTTVKETLEAHAAAIASKADSVHSHPYLPDTTLYAKGATQNGAAVSANKVNKAVTFKADGTGDTSGTTFDGSTARTISYNTIGAAASGHTHGTYEADIAAIEGNYVKFIADTSDNNKGKLYVGKSDTTNVIIFDCGGAADPLA